MRRRLGPAAAGAMDTLRSTATAMRAALPVFFGEDGVEACLLSGTGSQSVVESNPQIGKFLRPIATSPKMLPHVIACQRDLAPALRAEIVRISLGMKGAGARPQFSEFKPEQLQSVQSEWLEWSQGSAGENKAGPKAAHSETQPANFMELRAAAAATPGKSSPATARQNLSPAPFQGHAAETSSGVKKIPSFEK